MADVLTLRSTVLKPPLAPLPETRAEANRLSLVLVAGLTIVSLIIRLAHLDYQSLWLDEGYTLLFSGLPLPKLIAVGGAHEHPPLYYFLVHLVMSIHHSYLVPRSISVVAGTLSIPVLYALGVRMFDRGVGVVAATFLAVSPIHLWFSNDGRAYELAGLLVLLSYLLLLRALDRPGVVLWLGYVVATTACLYTEYTTALVLLPQGVFLLRARARDLTRSLLLAWGGAALLFAPWLPVWLHNASTVADNYWIPNPTWASLQSVVLELLGLETTCPTLPCTADLPPPPLLASHAGVVVGALAAATLITLLWAALRRNLEISVVVLWLMAPFAIVLLLSLHRSLFLDRVFLDAGFGLYLLLAWWLVHAVRRRVLLPFALILTIPLVGALPTVQSTYSTVTNVDWRSAVRDFQATYRPGQAVVYYPGPVHAIVSAYVPANRPLTSETPVWFHQYLDVPGWKRRYAHLTDSALADLQLSQAAAGHRAVWLLAQDYYGLPLARHWFTAHGFQLRLSQMYDGDARIELWDRGAPAGFGPAMLSGAFDRQWSHTGRVSLHGSTAAVSGRTALNRSFAVRPGTAYVVNLDYRCTPPAYPLVSVETMDLSGRSPQAKDPFGTDAAQFPRSKWYDWPALGVWVTQPFGFIAPPHEVRAILHLRTLWGSCSWRNIAIYRER